MRSRSAVSLLLILLAGLTLGGGKALAHAGERGFVLLMPTEFYVTGGAAAVLLSFLALAALPARWLDAAFAWRGVWRRPAFAIAGVSLGDVARVLAFPIFVAIVAIGFWGPQDPAWNLLPLTVWSLWWVVFTIASGLLGDLWRFANPWSGPVRLLRRAIGPARFVLPDSIGIWPAVIFFFGFVWFEIVGLAPTDPDALANAAALYWAFHFAGALAFGEAAWFGRAEAFSVFFRLIGRLAPAWTEADPGRAGRAITTLALPGARLVAPESSQSPEARYPISTGAFILLVLAALTFDGLVETFTWIAWLGLNPLEFTGRSAVVWQNSAGLLVAWALIGFATWTSVSFGSRLVNRRGQENVLFSRLALAMTPVALGYHFGHFLSPTLVQVQHALVALSSPLGHGVAGGAPAWAPDDWMGLGEYYVTTSFLYDAHLTPLIWQAQAGGVALGHLASVALAHAAAHSVFGSGRTATIAQAPFAILMVALTLFSLWLLASPTA